MKLGDLIDFGGKGMGYPIYPAMIRVFGLEETVFLCRIIWWQHDPEEWIEASIAKIELETGLKSDRQRRVRNSLEEKKIIECHYARLEHKLCFRILAKGLETELENDGKIHLAKPQKAISAKPQDATSFQTAKSQMPMPQDATSSIDKDFDKDFKKDIPADAGELLSIPENPAANGNGKAKKTPNPEHHKFIALWSEAYPEQFGRKYAFAGGRDAKAVSNLLAATGLPAEDLIACARKAWRTSGFWCEKAVTICTFQVRYNEIMAELRPVQSRQLVPNYENGF